MRSRKNSADDDTALPDETKDYRMSFVSLAFSDCTPMYSRELLGISSHAIKGMSKYERKIFLRRMFLLSESSGVMTRKVPSYSFFEFNDQMFKYYIFVQLWIYFN